MDNDEDDAIAIPEEQADEQSLEDESNSDEDEGAITPQPRPAHPLDGEHWNM